MRFYELTGEGGTVLDELRRSGLFLPADCGGRGSCGKCVIRLVDTGGAPPSEPTEREKEKLSEKELMEGCRLACQARIRGSFRISLPDDEEEMVSETGGIDGEAPETGRSGEEAPEALEQSIAVDLGTTTIAAALLSGGRVVRTEVSVNHQRSFGADVLSRIRLAAEGNGEKLRHLAEVDLETLAEKLGADPKNTRMVISGNTTMEHLLRGLSCEGLGAHPFTPVDLSLYTEGNRTFLPGISTFVGADIVSGIVATGMDQSDQIGLFLDLGTNGEMAIGKKDRILVSSAAAGPAFEGGSLSSGVAGIPGAISGVALRGRAPVLTTIGGKKPIGLCGSGVIEIIYELLAAGFLDRTGLLSEEYREEGFCLADGVTLTAGDVREVQLAKAAIRAGLETLLEAYGAEPEQIHTFYLAGGFGQRLNLKKAAGIGLFPEELLVRAEAAGNTSLQGAVLYASKEGMAERFLGAVRLSEEVSLSESPVFRENYLKYINFP